LEDNAGEHGIPHGNNGIGISAVSPSDLELYNNSLVWDGLKNQLESIQIAFCVDLIPVKQKWLINFRHGLRSFLGEAIFYNNIAENSKQKRRTWKILYSETTFGVEFPDPPPAAPRTPLFFVDSWGKILR
jgi:hypothetical protein